jgi:hypothetical protein
MYCGTEVTVKNEVHQCEFCEMELAASEIMMNGERKKNIVKPIISISHMNKPTRELMEMNTYELLVLLQLVRKERSSSFESMSEAKKYLHQAKEEGSQQAISILNDTLEAVIEDYSYVTRKAWVLENILAERMESVPQRITDKMLEKFFLNIQSRKSNPMIFSSGAKEEITN